MQLAVAPVAALASSTVLKLGRPIVVVPPLPGVTPPTIFLPYASACSVWKVPVAPVIPCVMTLVFLSMRMDISISLLRVLINGKLHQIIWINKDLLRGGQSIFSWCCDRHGRFVPRIGSRLSVIAFNLHKRRFATDRKSPRLNSSNY